MSKGTWKEWLPKIQKKNLVLCNVLKLNMPIHNNERFYWLTERRRVNKNIVWETQGSDSEINAGLHEPKPGDTWHLEVQGNILSSRACRNGQCLKTWSFQSSGTPARLSKLPVCKLEWVSTKISWKIFTKATRNQYLVKVVKLFCTEALRWGNVNSTRNLKFLNQHKTLYPSKKNVRGRQCHSSESCN